MSLDSRAEALLQALAAFNAQPIHTMSVEEVRARKQPPIREMPPIASQQDLELTTEIGPVPARLYQPESLLPEAPLIVYLHGGGWIMGELDHYDPLCRALASEAEMNVISLDYRLAPEHPYPAALEDCLAAIETLSGSGIGSAANSGTPRQRLIVAGDSSGGNLAAVVAQTFRGHLQVQIEGQILVYPVTDCDFERLSYQENGEGYMLTGAMMQWFWDLYCPDPVQRALPSASPLMIDSFADLPPAYLLTCQYDPLRDEGNAYAACLHNAGVETTHQEIPGMIHGFVRFLETFPQAQETIREIAQWSKRIATTASSVGPS